MRRQEVALSDSVVAAGSSRRASAYIDDGWDLVLATFDVGPRVESTWGGDDYEFWRRVKSDFVPRVLLELIKDRFQSEREFHAWLEEKGIPAEFSSWT
ncbi:MAG: hypothetical protein AB7I01_10665 [Gammaproteobacteria bacterium]